MPNLNINVRIKFVSTFKNAQYQTTNVGEEVERKELFYAIGGKANWCITMEKSMAGGSSSRN